MTRRGGAFIIDREGAMFFRATGTRSGRSPKAWQPSARTGNGASWIAKVECVIEPQYDSVTAFAEGLAGFEVGRTEESLGQRHLVVPSGPKGIHRPFGKRRHPGRVGRRRVHFTKVCAVVCTGGTMKPNSLLGGRELLSDRKYGYLDRTGRLLIPGEYDLAHSFSEGRAVVQIGDGYRRARHGYIDVRQSVIPFKLTSASEFKNGLAIVRRRGRKWRETTLLINPAGKWCWRCLTKSNLSLKGWPPPHRRTYGFIDIDGCWVDRAAVRPGGTFHGWPGRSATGRLVWSNRQGWQFRLGTDHRRFDV